MQHIHTYATYATSAPWLGRGGKDFQYQSL